MTDIPMTPDRERKIRMSRTHCEAARFEIEDERPLHVWGPSQYPTQEMCQRCTVMRAWAEDTDADDVVLLAKVDRLRARVAELEKQLAEYEPLNPQQCPAGLHTDWLIDSEHTHACPWCRVAELEGAPVDEAVELAEGQAQLDAMRADHPAPCRVPDSPDCTCPDKLPVFTRSDWDGPIAPCSFGQHMAALLPSGRIGRHRMGEGWINACPGVGKPPRADAQPEATP